MAGACYKKNPDGTPGELINPGGWGAAPGPEPEVAYEDDAGNKYGFNNQIIQKWTPDPDPMTWGETALAGATLPAKFTTALVGAASPYGEGGWQVPPLIQEPISAFKRLTDTPAGTIANPQNPENQQDMVTGLLSLYGGNALNPMAKVPKGALASGAMKEAAGLPMDQASRMARAKELGFDTDRILYHGTGRNFDAFDVGADKVTGGGLNDQGVFLTPDPKAASRYAETFGGDNPQVIPTYTRAQKPLSMSPAEFERLQGIAGALRKGEPIDEVKGIFLEGTLNDLGIPWDATSNVHPIDAIKAAGFDAIEKRAGRGGAEPEFMVFDPAKIRGVNAAFDPARAGENGLLLSDTGKPSLMGSAVAGAFADGAQSRILPPGDYIPLSLWDGVKMANQTRAGMRTTPTPFHKDYLLPDRPIDDADRQFGKMTNTIAVEYPNNEMQAFADPYEAAVAQQAWRDKIKRTGELLSDTGKPSLAGSVIAGAFADNAATPAPIRAYHGGPGSNPYMDGAGAIERFVPGRDGAVWSTDNPALAGDYTAARYPDRQAIYPLDVSFSNPYVVDRAAGYVDQRQVFQAAKDGGHDGIIFKNADDSVTGMPYRGETTQYAALQPNTVRSATTGEILFSDTGKPSLMGSATAGAFEEDWQD